MPKSDQPQTWREQCNLRLLHEIDSLNSQYGHCDFNDLNDEDLDRIKTTCTLIRNLAKQSLGEDVV